MTNNTPQAHVAINKIHIGHHDANPSYIFQSIIFYTTQFIKNLIKL